MTEKALFETDTSNSCENDTTASKEGTAITENEEDRYLTGWKLHLITLQLLISIFIVQMESSIVSTSVLAITDQLGGYSESSWLFTAYLLTYCGLQMVWAKASDIIGRKKTLLASLCVFTLFSGLCGASQSLHQLIHFRWLQGSGGCGVFALVQLVFFELVPPRKWPTYISLVTGMIALSLIAGPLLGGAITQNASWRWIFLLNVPVGVLTMVGIAFAFPSKLWNEPISQVITTATTGRTLTQSLQRIDVIGSALLIGACVLFTTGAQQAATTSKWDSPTVLALLVCAVPFAVAFFAWQRYVTQRNRVIEPVFPWRFCQSRIRMGMIINTYLVGTVLYVMVAQIPQQYTTVHGLSAFSAATKLLPFGVLVPSGSAMAAALMGKPRIPPCWIVLAGAVLQLLGLVLLSKDNGIDSISAARYGFHILIGTGVGFVNAALTLLVPYVMDKKDLATGTSAISQFRVLGGTIGIAIAASISTPYIRRNMNQFLDNSTTQGILERTEMLRGLDMTTQREVRGIFEHGYNLQTLLLIGFAAAQIPITGLMWTNQVAEPGK
ncbi:MFS general substrate transporter [Sporormia fimetaria CBS 119925]|uniref:MFS general substrate transporter n=1 Tax=Sporormia fimetaria CBS 119925 TaxID=1340428 RepID=A0A6A6UWX2_9PLEO|nr:MFS general substrate transporter [Sporormia fimetaria CBS 119925]